MNFREINSKLRKRENWTDELRYVHKTRIIFGLIFGFILGFLIAKFII